MKEFIDAAITSETLKKYDAIIRDMAKSGERISLKDICGKRKNYADAIINEIGIKDASREDAFEFVHKIISVIDMTLLENAIWVGEEE